MVKISECSDASRRTDLLRFNRSKAVPLCERHAVRMQVANVLARNCSATGVQNTPKSLTGSFMRNVEPQRLCPFGAGKSRLRRDCWRVGLRCLKEANAL